MLRPTLLPVGLILILVLVTSGMMRSQNTQIQTRVDLVVVPVSVRDNNGVLVTGLDRDDFSVFEDGKPQRISNFSTDPQPLSAAIVIDDGVNGNALKRLVPLLSSLAAAFVTEDEVTTFRYDHVVWQLSDFTNDPKQIEQSFRDLPRIAETRPDVPEEPELYRKIENKTPALIRAIAGLFSIGGGASPASPSPARAPSAAPDSRVLHSAIYEAATALHGRAKDRRKIVLLISDGAESEPRVSVIPGKTTVHSFKNNVDLLLENDIEVYSVHTLGALLETSTGALDGYARATGGDVYGGKSESDMKFSFERIAEQARTQYVLGYVSSNTAPPQGVYRKIDVKSGDAAQKRKIIHRTAYMQLPIPK